MQRLKLKMLQTKLKKHSKTLILLHLRLRRATENVETATENAKRATDDAKKATEKAALTALKAKMAAE